MGGAEPMKRLFAALIVAFAFTAAAPALAADSYDIKIVNASDINMVAKDSRLPIIIRNDYDSEARVLVHVIANNSKVTAPEATPAVVPGFSTYTAKVPVTAISSGDVELEVWLTSMNGVRLTENVKLNMHINSSLEVFLIGGLATLVVLLGSVGVVRTLRKKSRASA
ncbi:unannotated protein [freshwater metagenome]|uniref:Unannotated protein n=1 Tax=freshwater metagenome TaxID=449393 RepID=A0A6J7JQL0_9ZZZZ